MENMNEKEGMGMSMGSRMYHWFCCVLPTVSLIMWVAALIFVIFSWIAVFTKTPETTLWGIGAQWWIWNVLMFGILALFGGSKKIGKHEV